MIIRVEHQRSYTVIDNQPIEDGTLSFKALGVLTYLLSRPDSWEADRNQLAKAHRDGIDSVRAALQELTAAGYIERRRERRPDGTFDWVQVIHETPTSGGFPTSGLTCDDATNVQVAPVVDYPPMDKPPVDNRAVVSKEEEVRKNKEAFSSPIRTPKAPPPALALAEVQDRARTVGFTAGPGEPFTHAAIDAAVRVVGWGTICQSENQTGVSIQFQAAYRSLTADGKSG